MPDYECWSIWNLEPIDNEDYNIDPSNLPIPDDLKLRLSKWEDLYDATLNKNDPLNSGFKTENERKYFNEIGLGLFQSLKVELSDYEVQYFGGFEQ